MKTKLICIFLTFSAPLVHSYETKLPPCQLNEPKNNCWAAFNIFGTQYMGEFKDNQPDGFGTYIFVNGDYYIGFFKENKFYGEGTYTYRDGEKKTGNWINNKLESEK